MILSLCLLSNSMLTYNILCLRPLSKPLPLFAEEGVLSHCLPLFQVLTPIGYCKLYTQGMPAAVWVLSWRSLIAIASRMPVPPIDNKWGGYAMTSSPFHVNNCRILPPLWGTLGTSQYLHLGRIIMSWSCTSKTTCCGPLGTIYPMRCRARYYSLLFDVLVPSGRKYAVSNF